MLETFAAMKILLVDNGSLEPAAVFALRDVARRLSATVGQQVYPVSLAHSDKIPAAELGNVPAQRVEPFLREQLEREDECEFVIVPFFIGPSRAVTHALPKLIEKLRAEFPSLRVRIASVLHEAGDTTLARILVDRVRDMLSEVAKTERETEPRTHDQRVRVALGERHKAETHVRVALVDHGSPAPGVTAVRDEVAAQLAVFLGEDTRIVEVAPCSMERRPGAAYAFNEPLLETLLTGEGWRTSTESPPLIIVAQLFLLPGRHAGPRGDIAQICARAADGTVPEGIGVPSLGVGEAGTAEMREAAAPKTSPLLRALQTAPLSTHPLLIDLLAQRLANSQRPRLASI